jgi:hypothetical protein
MRFINMLNCAPGPTCPDHASYENILKAVEAANEVFQAVGVQFALKKVDRYNMPNFYDLRQTPVPAGCGPSPLPKCDKGCQGGGAGDEKAWQVVRADLQQVFTIPSGAWADAHEKTTKEWIRAVDTIYSPDDELTVFVPKYSCGVYSWYPDTGKGLTINGATMGQSYKVVHEMGHYFGMPHPWDNNSKIDPWSGVAHVRSDEYDLVFKPGTSPANPHVYFGSKAEAQVYESSLRRIYRRGQGDGVNNCTRDGATQVVTCDIADYGNCTPPCYTEQRSTGAYAMKGLAQTVGTGKAANVMAYFANFSVDPYMFSDSQIELIRRYLRYDKQIPQATANEMQQSTVMSGRRPRLGSWNLREIGLEKIDFDGDGLRDIGVWIAPTTMGVKGRFKVWLSSQNFSESPGSYIDVAFGELGDIPVVADFGCIVGTPGCSNGMQPDGRTDIAVYQPGGGYDRNTPTDARAWWRWCRTPTPPASLTDAMCDCPSCGEGFTNCGDGCRRVATQWGLREDVPLPGLNFLYDTTEVAIFRPNSNGLWAWRQADSSSSSGPYKNLGGRGSVLLPGRYDGDTLTDIAVYEPMLARFNLLRSDQNWSINIPRQFDSKFIPQATGTVTDRSGAIPLSGMYRSWEVCEPWPHNCSYPPRRVFSLWFPADGTWNTLWDTLNDAWPPSYESCQWGIGRLDVPITGLDRNGDGWSDMAVFRSNQYAGSWVHIRNTTPTANGCAGQIQSFPFDDQFFGRIRTRVFAVADMTGDSKPELVRLSPDYGWIEWRTSESDWATPYYVWVGNQRAVFF